MVQFLFNNRASDALAAHVNLDEEEGFELAETT